MKKLLLASVVVLSLGVIAGFGYKPSVYDYEHSYQKYTPQTEYSYRDGLKEISK